MKTVRKIVVNVKQQGLPYVGEESVLNLEGFDFGGYTLANSHRAILSLIATASSYSSDWRAVKLSNVQYRFGEKEDVILIAADQLEEKGLLESVVFKGEVYFVPTEKLATGLWLAWTDDRLSAE